MPVEAGGGKMVAQGAHLDMSPCESIARVSGKGQERQHKLDDGALTQRGFALVRDRDVGTALAQHVDQRPSGVVTSHQNGSLKAAPDRIHFAQQVSHGAIAIIRIGLLLVGWTGGLNDRRVARGVRILCVDSG